MKKAEFYTINHLAKGGIQAVKKQGWTDGDFFYYKMMDYHKRGGKHGKVPWWYAIEPRSGLCVYEDWDTTREYVAQKAHDPILLADIEAKFKEPSDTLKMFIAMIEKAYKEDE